MSTRRTLHALTAIVLAATAVGSATAHAAPKKKLVPTTSKFYLRASGCGTSQEAGRLEPKSGADDSTGCGTVGGLPVDEVFYRTDGATYADFKTGTKGVPVTMDATRKVTGAVATQGWLPAGGVGKVEVDITIAGTTTTGKVVSFGETKVTADASPTAEVTKIPFELAVPASAAKLVFKSLTMSIATHGANMNMNAQHYDGDSFVVFPSYTLR